MKIITHKVNGIWVRFPGSPALNPVKVARLVEDGVWAQQDLDEHGLEAAEPFQPPEGKIATGEERFSSDGRQQIFDVEDVVPARRLLRKSIVQARLIDAGLMEAAYAALTANPTYFARWFAPDRPEVYADDPDALILLDAIGADAEAIMAPEGM